jgi:BirA family biotin operon repressor/biotin-[acetyl-CoA-carboxylase] ligase
MESDLESDEAMLQALSGGRFVAFDHLMRSLGLTGDELAGLAEELRQRGYDIEERPDLGYRMIGTADLLTAPDIRGALRTEVLGRRILSFARIGSTNSVALDLARGGADDGTLVIADHQTRGRGRMGREWWSPPGSSISMSLILRPRTAPERTPAITLVAAGSVAWAVRAAGLPVWVSWPNDIVAANGRKVCGILSEMEATGERVDQVVIGIGINVNQRKEDIPAELCGTATSLLIELDRVTIRPDLVASVLNMFEPAYREFCSRGLGPLLPRIRGCCALIGERVAISVENVEIVGQVLDIDDDGRLVLRHGEGKIERFLAGEVQKVSPSALPADAGMESRDATCS